MANHSSENSRDTHGVGGARGAYFLLMDLKDKGFPQASPLAAALLEMNLAYVYLCGNQASEAHSKLLMVPKHLYQSAALLKLPEFSDSTYRLQRALDLLTSGCTTETNDRAKLADAARNELSSAISMLVRGADTLLMTGFGGRATLPHIEEARAGGVADASSRLRALSRHQSAPYLGQAIDILYDAVQRFERGDVAMARSTALASGLLLLDAERHFIDRSFRAYFEHPECDFRSIARSLQQARDALNQGNTWQARKLLAEAVKQSEFI